MTVAPLLNQSPKRFHEAMGTNFFGAPNGSLAVLPAMLERRQGAIINIASIGGLIAVPHMLPYTASKLHWSGFRAGCTPNLNQNRRTRRANVSKGIASDPGPISRADMESARMIQTDSASPE